MKLKTIYILLLTTAAILAQSAKQQRIDDLSDRPVDIARVKTEHYKKSGYQVLPTFLTDSVIGPGKFVGIEDATVRSGTILHIRPGTTLMFEPKKRLIVEGKLQAKANVTEPIHLTNVPVDLRYFKIVNPDSLWGGIQIDSAAIVELDKVKISCAINGLTASEEPSLLSISCVDMSNLVTERFTLTKVATPAGQDWQCFSFNFPIAPPKALPDISEKNTHPAKRANRLGLKLGWSGLTLVGAGITGWGLYQYSHNLSLYNESNDPLLHSKAEVDKYERDGKAGRILAIVGGAVTLLSTAGLVMTFTF